MNKVKTMQEAYRVFEYLGIKEVTKPFQKRKGTEVWELPFKTMYYNGSTEINRFSVYKNGYVRKMVVYGKNNASQSCYQLNRVRKVASFVKDYKWSDTHECSVWTGKYRKIYNNERIMIDNHRDRVVYLCNYILKNYYRSGKMNLVGEYTMKRVAEIHGEWWRSQRKQDDLPFDGHYANPVHPEPEDVQVIINGHRYNLS
tara:strand:+ start:174 stop:773 length:600 start_codon:yes stop_codon:yes gene_type:complete